LFALTPAVATIAAPPTAPPDFTAAIQSVENHLRSSADYQPGDLLTQSQIEGALEQLRKDGWELSDPGPVVKAGLPDDSFLARELATPAGRKFMRKIARYPGGFSQLDRLSSISRGKMIVRDLIRRPGGDTFVEYLTTTNGGRKLGGMLAATPNGVDLNKPTGRIYTADDLISALQRSLAKEAGK
jgi:hypothetical protein